MTVAPELAAADQPAPIAVDAPLQKTNLLGLALADLEAEMVALGLPKFRARQVWRWVWRHGLSSFDEMSDLGKPVRELPHVPVAGAASVVALLAHGSHQKPAGQRQGRHQYGHRAGAC